MPLSQTTLSLFLSASVPCMVDEYQSRAVATSYFLMPSSQMALFRKMSTSGKQKQLLHDGCVESRKKAEKTAVTQSLQRERLALDAGVTIIITCNRSSLTQ